jgi:hypothetical protein
MSYEDDSYNTANSQYDILEVVNPAGDLYLLFRSPEEYLPK